MTDFTSTPFTRQFKKDCEDLHVKLARERAVAEKNARESSESPPPAGFTDPTPT